MRDTYIYHKLCIFSCKRSKQSVFGLLTLKTLFGGVTFKFVVSLDILLILYACEVIHLTSKGLISQYVQK